MNTFKRKALFTAVLASLGAAGTAEAVYLSPNNTGQALVYPYYTVQSAQGNSWNTFVSVVNTTTRAKAVKVRVLEGKASAEVLDFNLFLSPNDVWTAAIIPADATAGSPGHLITADASCTAPVIGISGADFRNYTYAQAYDSIVGQGLDRTREGYIEMIEMGTLAGSWASNATHNSAGIPANCGFFQQAGLTPVVGTDITAPTGGLIGTGTLINVNSGTDVGYKADALDAFRDRPLYSFPGNAQPGLGDATPGTSLVINAGGIDPVLGGSTTATVYRSDWNTASAATGLSVGTYATAAVFMHSSVMNEYVLDAATRSATDWVITQPLKRFFVTATTAIAPYSNVLTTSGACEQISFQYFNREEKGQAASGIDFSPLPPNAPANSLCWESNVLSVRNGSSTLPSDTSVSTVFGSTNVTNVNVNSAFQNGWAMLTFTGANATATPTSGTPVGMGSDASSQRISVGTNATTMGAVTAGAQTFFGLPSTGFMVRTFQNGALNCGTGTCQGNYSALFNHSYRTTITP